MPQFAIKEDVESVREDLRIHSADDRAFQERMFGYLKSEFAEVNSQFNMVNAKISTMWDESTFRKGAESGSIKADEEYGKAEAKKEKWMIVGGWTINAFIAAITAYGTMKAIGH